MIAIFLVLLTAAYMFVAMPVFAGGFGDWSFLCFIWGAGLMFVAVKVMLQRGGAGLTGSFIGWLVFRLFGERIRVPAPSTVTGEIVPRKYRIAAWTGLALIVIAVFNAVVLPILLSNPLFFSARFHNLIGKVEESTFVKDVEPLNPAQIRIIDDETAARLADKKIGEVPALGSETKLGRLVLQQVDNKLYYVAPLEHRGVFQWISNYTSGSHGYILVSAIDPQDVRLVQDIKGKPVNIRYQMGAYLMEYLPRWIYLHGYVNVGLTDYTFQIDNDYNPYWVITLYDKTIGYAGDNATGILTVNAQTGEIIKYAIDKAPNWASRIQPEEFVHEQIENWGQYIYGFWNSVFAKTGTLKPSGTRMHLIYGSDNRVYWYTGMTSSGGDDSTVGFILVDSRNKKAKFYKVAGATEESAAKSAEGQVQEKGYRSGYPLLYNVHGIPTYIAPLKDKEGLLKLVAFISVENYNIVGVGGTIDSAMRAYMQNLANKGDTVVPGQFLKEQTISGKVSRVATIVKGSETMVYFMLDNDAKVFWASSGLNVKLPLLKSGDVVEISFSENTLGANEIKTFKPNY